MEATAKSFAPRPELATLLLRCPLCRGLAELDRFGLDSPVLEDVNGVFRRCELITVHATCRGCNWSGNRVVGTLITAVGSPAPAAKGTK